MQIVINCYMLRWLSKCDLMWVPKIKHHSPPLTSETDISKSPQEKQTVWMARGKRFFCDSDEVTQCFSLLEITEQKYTFKSVWIQFISQTFTHTTSTITICYCMFNLSLKFWMLSQPHQHLIMFVSTLHTEK